MTGAMNRSRNCKKVNEENDGVRRRVLEVTEEAFSAYMGESHALSLLPNSNSGDGKWEMAEELLRKALPECSKDEMINGVRNGGGGAPYIHAKWCTTTGPPLVCCVAGR